MLDGSRHVVVHIKWRTNKVQSIHLTLSCHILDRIRETKHPPFGVPNILFLGHFNILCNFGWTRRGRCTLPRLHFSGISILHPRSSIFIVVLVFSLAPLAILSSLNRVSVFGRRKHNVVRLWRIHVMIMPINWNRKGTRIILLVAGLPMNTHMETRTQPVVSMHRPRNKQRSAVQTVDRYLPSHCTNQICPM